MKNKLLILVLSCLMLLSSISFSPVVVAAEENNEEETSLVEEELLNAEENETEPLPINYYEVSQNESNDLIIRGNDDMLQDIKANYGSVILERNGEQIVFDHSEYYLNYNSDDETVYFQIENWKLKDRNVVNGEYSVSLEVDNGGVQYTVSNGVSIDLSGVKYYIVANEDSEGNIIISGDRKTLEGIIAPQVYDQSVGELTEWGGSISLVCSEGGNIFFNNYESRNGSLVTYRRTEIVWSENGESLVISHDIALSKGIKNDEYTFEVGLGNQEYQWGCNGFTYTHGVKEADAEIAVSKGDIIISGDTDFLNALIRPRVNNGDDFGRITLSNSEDNHYWSFDNYQYNGFLDESYKIQDGKVVLSKDKLVESGVTDGFYTIEVSAYGYETVEGKVSLSNVAKESPEISVQYNAAGDLLIQSSDADFINSLCSYSVEYEGGNGFESGSSRLYFDYYGYSIYLHNYLSVYMVEGEAHASGFSPIEKIDNNTACVRANVLKKEMSYLPSGSDSSETEVHICAAGYQEKTVSLELCPLVNDWSSAEITSDENGLSIHVADKNYFDQLVAYGCLRAGEKNEFYSYFTFEDHHLNEDVLGRSRVNYEDVSISTFYTVDVDLEKQTIFIPKDHFPSSLTTGEYRTTLCNVPGYIDYSEIVYIYGTKKAPVDAVVLMNNDGDLEIRSNDKEWLSLMAKSSFNSEEIKGALELIPTGSAVSVKDYEVWTSAAQYYYRGDSYYGETSARGVTEEEVLVVNGKEYSKHHVRSSYEPGTIGYNYERLMTPGTWIYEDEAHNVYHLTEDGKFMAADVTGNAIYLDDNSKIIYSQLTGDGVYLPYGMIDISNYGYDTSDTSAPIRYSNGTITVSKDYLKNNGVTSGTFYVTVFTSDYETVYTKVELDYIAPRVEVAYEGDTLQMTVGTKDSVTWNSSDTSIATVDNTGLVEFKPLNGATSAQVTISATVNGYTDSHTITVKNHKIMAPDEDRQAAHDAFLELHGLSTTEYESITMHPLDHYRDIALPDNVVWQNGDVELQFGAYAYFLPEDNERYSFEVEPFYRGRVTVEKYPAEMDYRYMDISSTTYTMKPGDDVRNIKLPIGWEWGGWYPSVNDVGEYEFTVYYVPSNPRVYEGTETTVTVKAIEPSTIYAKSLTLTDEIGVNFYLDLNDDVKNDRFAYALINGQYYGVSSAQRVEIDGHTYYKFTHFVNAKEMNDNIEFVLYSNNLNALLYVGDENCTEGYNYSVSKYLSSVIKNSSDDEMIALAEAMKEYGNYSQAYFDYGTYGTTSPAIESVNPEMLSNYAYSLSGAALGINYYGSSLVLRDTTSIRHYFILADNQSIADYTFKVNGSNVVPTAYGKYYVVEIANLYASDLGNSFEVTVSRNGSDGVFAINYSALSYVNTVLTSPSLQDKGHLFLRNLSKAIYLYNTKAIAYNNSVTH